MDRRRVALLCGLGAIVAAAGFAACMRTRAPAAAVHARTDARVVLMISIDGLRRDSLDDTTHAIPNLRRLASEGAVARALVPVWPSVTYPAHTTMVTGVAPKTHGVLNNTLFDPKGELEGAWYWNASAIKSPALWDAAEQAGIPTANVAWPVTVGARARWNIPQIWKTRTPADDPMVAAACSPGLADELRAAGLALPAEHRTDAERTDAALYILERKDARFVLVYLTDLDNAQHDKGPKSPEAWATLEGIDRELGAILDAAHRATSRLSVVLVSDHGFRGVTREVRPNVVLSQAGLIEVEQRGPDEEPRVVRWRAATWKAGGSAAILVQPDLPEKTRAEIRAAFTDLARDPASGIARVHDGAEIERLGGFPGSLVVLEARDGFVFGPSVREPLVSPTKMRGHHGFAPTDPEMAATLILAGDGIVPKAPLGDVAMIDVAPTVARLLGVALPSAEGKPLAAALR